MPPSDTFFTKSPHWNWLIVFYFFLGGIAAGCFVIAAFLDLFGKPYDRRLANLAYKIALPVLALCPILLIVDLDRPERFWHMLIQDHGGGIMLKTYSPMSLGSWALMVFSLFAGLAFLGALEWPPLAFLGRGVLRKIIAVLGGVFGFIVAGYTGILLSVTNRPVWADSPLFGALFLLSAATTAAALVAWLGRGRAHPASVAWVERFESMVAIVEIITLVATILTLGAVARVWASAWGVVLAVGVVLGLIVPIVLHRRGRSPALAAALALLGGLTVRAVVILSVGAVLSSCVSPEEGRARAGGPGADVGNHGSPVVLHGPTDMFHKTPHRDATR